MLRSLLYRLLMRFSQQLFDLYNYEFKLWIFDVSLARLINNLKSPK